MIYGYHGAEYFTAQTELAYIRFSGKETLSKVGIQLPRHVVDRRLERAASLITHARWWLAGILLCACTPLLRFLLCCGAPIAFIPLIAFTMSQPLEDMADDVRNRHQKPLIIWMVLVGFLLLGTIVLQGLAIAWLINVARFRPHDFLACLLANLMALCLMCGVAWVLWMFISAWRGVRSLQEGEAPAFPVVTAKAQEVPTVLPPRPKR